MSFECSFSSTVSGDVSTVALSNTTRQKQQQDHNDDNDVVEDVVKGPKLLLNGVENPDYSWMWRLLRLQKAHILSVNQTQYELACLSTMGGAYSICRYPKEALLIAQRQEAVGIRMGSKQIQCHAKLYQYINLIFLGKKKAGLRMLEAAKQQAEEVAEMKEGSSAVRKHCDVTENWLNNEIKYKSKKYKSKSKPGGTLMIA